MNIVIRTKDEIRWRLPLSRLPRIPQLNLPTYIYLEVLALVMMSLILVNWTLIVRQDVQPPNNPLAPYANALINITEANYSTLALRKGRCAVVSMDNQQFCTMSPADGPFSYLTGSLNNGVVGWSSFAVRENTLMVGDLVLLWGKPTIYHFQKSTFFEWPDLGISASGRSPSRQFDYHIPITCITIQQVKRKAA